ncbi:hypothetical protein EVAR_31910_1 [Eumeta japonica]|uniref:Uncharacterized protein n=1 Tax=Eumeta variegata TaxID=151549 RepID=A0A4C1XMW8_EUMVA|nr:hypothetical protein EVAR_31910_1 [Eumeta japonica]
MSHDGDKWVSRFTFHTPDTGTSHIRADAEQLSDHSDHLESIYHARILSLYRNTYVASKASFVSIIQQITDLPETKHRHIELKLANRARGRWRLAACDLKPQGLAHTDRIKAVPVRVHRDKFSVIPAGFSPIGPVGNISGFERPKSGFVNIVREPEGAPDPYRPAAVT